MLEPADKHLCGSWMVFYLIRCVSFCLGLSENCFRGAYPFPRAEVTLLPGSLACYV